MKSSSEISQEISGKEKELKQALNNANILSQEKLKQQRQIIEINLKKKDTELSLDKANHIIKVMKIDISLKQKEFWATKSEGL